MYLLGATIQPTTVWSKNKEKDWVGPFQPGKGFSKKPEEVSGLQGCAEVCTEIRFIVISPAALWRMDLWGGQESGGRETSSEAVVNLRS